MMLGNGEVTLAGGRATVSVPRIPDDAVVLLSRKTALGGIGDLGWSINARTSFSIVSLNVLDISVVRWVVLR